MAFPSSFNRRQFIGLSAASGAAATLGLHANGQTIDDRFTHDLKPSGIYPFMVEDIQCIAICDGMSKLEPIQPLVAPEAKPQEMKQVLQNRFLPTDHALFYFNTLIVDTGKATFLIDTGYGSGGPPTAGRTAERLKTAGYSLEDIHHILITHAHPDHIGGLRSDSGKPLYPQADVLIPKAEYDFWNSKAPDLSKNTGPEEFKKGVVAGAQAAFEANQDVIKVISPDHQLPEGIELVPLPGHTPGHHGVRIGLADASLLHIADLAHHFELHLARPYWSTAFDVNPAQAKATRAKTLKQLAKTGERVFGYHMPFPGLGHVQQAGSSKSGDHYRWVTEPYREI